MRCYFCQEHIGDIVARPPHEDNANYLLACHRHQMVDVMHHYGYYTHGLLRVVFYGHFNDKVYEIELRPLEDKTLILDASYQIIKEFNYLLDITPENNKLQTILTFL